MKKIFIIPGFKQKATDKQFVWLRKFLVKKGFEVSLVSIEWDHHTMSDYVLEFENFYHKNKASENYILGFSFGAMIAFITANNLKPNKIYLCSLSPYFKEDISKVAPGALRYIGKNRVADSLTRSGKKIAKELTVPGVVFYGEKEARLYPQLKIRCEETAKLTRNIELVIVKDSPHDISNPEYVRQIKAQFEREPLLAHKRP